MITNHTASMNASASTDAIAAIRANSHLYVGRYDTTNNILNVRQVSDSDKTLWASGGSITFGEEDDLFMKLPRFKWKCEEVDTDIWELTFASSDAISGSGWNLWEGDTFIGVYKAYINNNKVYSKSRVTPTVNRSWTDFTACARARQNNNNYRLVTYEAHQIMCLLGYGWLGTTDAQGIVGAGTSSHSKTTGLTNSKGMSDSSAFVDGNSTSINFWGLENWWGDISEWVDNLKSSDAYGVNILGDDRTTVDRNVAPCASSIGEIKKLKLGTNGDVLPATCVTNGNYNKAFADVGYIMLGIGYVANRSSVGLLSEGGLACLAVCYGASSIQNNNSSRLLYKGNYKVVDSL